MPFKDLSIERDFGRLEWDELCRCHAVIEALHCLAVFDLQVHRGSHHIAQSTLHNNCSGDGDRRLNNRAWELGEGHQTRLLNGKLFLVGEEVSQGSAAAQNCEGMLHGPSAFVAVQHPKFSSRYWACLRLEQIHQLLHKDSNRRGDVEVKLFTLLQAQLLKPLAVMECCPISKQNLFREGNWLHKHYALLQAQNRIRGLDSK